MEDAVGHTFRFFLSCPHGPYAYDFVDKTVDLSNNGNDRTAISTPLDRGRRRPLVRETMMSWISFGHANSRKKLLLDTLMETIQHNFRSHTSVYAFSSLKAAVMSFRQRPSIGGRGESTASFPLGSIGLITQLHIRKPFHDRPSSKFSPESRVVVLPTGLSSSVVVHLKPGSRCVRRAHFLQRPRPSRLRYK